MKVLSEIAKVIKENKKFVISSHINPDGDSSGSQLAMYSILKKMKKDVEIIDTDPIPRIYKFLPFSEKKIIKYDKNFDFDVAIILDCGNIDRLGNILVDIKKIKNIINIDHHFSNTNFGSLNYVDGKASSTGEMIFRFAKYLNLHIDHGTAKCLYVAIMTDTGNFKFENTTSEAFGSVAELISYGLHPGEISKKIFENYTLNSMHLLGLSLETLKKYAHGKVAYMFVTKEMFKATSTKSEDTEGFVNHTRAIEGVDMGVFFRETENGTVKVSMRSKQLVDTNKIASYFGGGGHARASGCDIRGDLETVTKKVLNKIEEELERIGVN
ncbi:MAG: bifunctional oligoribonuclease/PAP phosphatase NrnA [Candidatus Firestonebacteria bacterium]|nr:bifunctional oligoribonuclease/PAP phosphatase NrnA [Candidatus Firestonebacteria bacterium]